MSADLKKNYFELLGMPAQFSLDTSLLDQHYRKLQAEVHPDRFVAASAGERMQSMQWATQVNEAYRTLRQPTDRARYLLALNGVDTEEENNTAMPTDFLMLQMEWREAVEDAYDSKSISTLDTLLQEMRQQTQSLQQTLTGLLDEHKRWHEAAAVVRKLSFIDKIRADVEHKVSKLEDE